MPPDFVDGFSRPGVFFCQSLLGVKPRKKKGMSYCVRVLIFFPGGLKGTPKGKQHFLKSPVSLVGPYLAALTLPGVPSTHLHLGGSMGGSGSCGSCAGRGWGAKSRKQCSEV